MGRLVHELHISLGVLPPSSAGEDRASTAAGTRKLEAIHLSRKSLWEEHVCGGAERLVNRRLGFERGAASSRAVSASKGLTAWLEAMPFQNHGATIIFRQHP